MIIGVVGNEACDADSIISAIALAALRSLQHPENKYLPCVQMDLAGLGTRFDFLEIAKISNYAEWDFFSMTDVDADAWILVDHNSPSASMHAKFGEVEIIEIVDHHAPSNPPTKADLTDIRTVGSCATLVAEKCLAVKEQIPKELLTMLLLTILLDTSNFSIPRNKTTETDRKVFSSLSERLGLTSTLHLNSLFEQVANAKCNKAFWFGSALPTILAHDLKNFPTARGERVGIATILRDIASLDLREIASFAASRSFPYFAVIGATAPQRELLMCVPDANVGILPLLVEKSQLELLRTERTATHQLTVFRVGEASFSRKQLAPFLQALL